MKTITIQINDSIANEFIQHCINHCEINSDNLRMYMLYAKINGTEIPQQFKEEKSHWDVLLTQIKRYETEVHD